VSAAPGLVLLAELRAAGLTVQPQGAGRVFVEPRERLTPELRARILERKPALLAALEAERVAALDLARRVREMAARWQYSRDDLAEALEAAQRDPSAWLACCLADERFAGLEHAATPFMPGEVHPYE